VFHPEFGRFMLEATPGKPWGIEFKELLEVEPDMKLRYGYLATPDIVRLDLMYTTGGVSRKTTCSQTNTPSH
jgi:hypothetical protein